MASQGDNQDALLDKLDGLIQSGRARKRRDQPPVLTDAIPHSGEDDIPTLTDAVEVPGTAHTKQPPEQAEEHAEQPAKDTLPDLDTPLEFEPAMRSDPEPEDIPDESDKSTSVETETRFELPQDEADADAPVTPEDLQDSISARLVSVVDREMNALTEHNPDHKEKLSVLQRSLRFALPELVRLRLQEPPRGSDDAGNDSAEPES